MTYTDSSPNIVFVTETENEAKALRERLGGHWQGVDVRPLCGALYGMRYEVVVILPSRKRVEADEKARNWVKRELKVRLNVGGTAYYAKEKK